MINYETILSSYDDKLTLMQWLKKVEAALKDASATGFHVNKRGNATITFSIDFANGETLESEPLVLQQGESVASGEIRNGHLFLTLTNGDELDCGSLFNGEVPSLNVRSLEVSGGLLLGDDANAAIGGDLVVHGLTEVENIRAYGDVETESLTAAGDEISAKKPVVEVMSDYDLYQISSALQNVYCGVCKNGNKLTFALSFDINLSEQPSYGIMTLAKFTIPDSTASKLITKAWAGLQDVVNAGCADAVNIPQNAAVRCNYYAQKSAIDGRWRLAFNLITSALSLNTPYTIRIEQTYLLSENLAA